MSKVVRWVLFSMLGMLAIGAAPVAQAAETATGSKERLVLMPLRVGPEDAKMQSAFETSLIEGLSQKYEVFAGEKVRQKATEIFNRESASTTHHECDETRCLQDIAAAFQSELIAIANVTRDGNGYVVSLSITNIFDEKSVYSKSLPCTNCGNFQVIRRLKELTGMQVKEEAEHYNWSFGVMTGQHQARTSNAQPSGTSYGLRLDYDLSNAVRQPVFMRFGLDVGKTTATVHTMTVAGGVPTNVDNSLTESDVLLYVTANYRFREGGDNRMHPFVGIGGGVKHIKQGCSASAGFGCLNYTGTKAVGVLDLGVQYMLVSTFGFELGITADSQKAKTLGLGMNFAF